MRLLWADTLKGILIIIVILGHAIQYRLGEDCFHDTLWNVIYSFHMPCFFAVSGMFAVSVIKDKESLIKSIWRRIRQLMIPMVIWQFIINLLSQSSLTFDILSYFDCGSFWFLWALFFINVLWILASFASYTIKIQPIWFHLLIILSLTGIMIFTNYKEHGFQYIAYYYIYYAFGFILHKHLKYHHYPLVLYVCAFLLWFVGSLFWRMHETPPFMSTFNFVPTALLNYCYRYFVGFVAILAFYGLSERFLNDCKQISTIGILSLGIYTTHLVLFKIVYPYLDTLSSSNALIISLSFIIFTVISIITVYLIHRSTILSTYLLGKIKK